MQISADKKEVASSYWDEPAEALMARIGSGPGGLSSAEAKSRLKGGAASRLKPGTKTHFLWLLAQQFNSSIIWILIFAATLSYWLGEHSDALIIGAIVIASGMLGFRQEYGAANAVAKLLALVQVKTRVMRDGVQTFAPASEIVPGDIVLLEAGAQIPGDGIVLATNTCYVDEAALTGETFPSEKQVGTVATETPLSQRSNTVFMGTHVVSGTATMLVMLTGCNTQLGRVTNRLRLRAPETEFERGIRRFGNLLLEITLILTLAIFAVNVLLHKPMLDSFLFAVALAVGLTPQLLPAIISINLASGAKRMARASVIVKRLAAIENFGSMDVLCSDKTGTLTEGVVQVKGAQDISGDESEAVFLLAFLNATFESGFVNPIDTAILAQRQIDISGYSKVDEIPYDFIRKRLSVLVRDNEANFLMATKGAVANVLEVCAWANTAYGIKPLAEVRSDIDARFALLSADGLRVLGIASKSLTSGPECTPKIDKSAEEGLIFAGFLVLSDPPKKGIEETISGLRELGIALKVITGDNRLVAANLCRAIDLDGASILTGSELHSMSEAALTQRVGAVHVFAEIEPNQKERIILALQKSGQVVGYIGDGINDAPALHAADIGISVDGAVDVAREAADIVLLKKDLGVLVQGVREGRVTFSNTLKYIFMATSANFGNMFSMAGASLFLPFLPLLPKQILLANMLTDCPEMTIAGDSVDPEVVLRPRRFEIGFIRSFMLVFGLLSSVYDLMTFGVLRIFLHAGPAEFRTGWFVESVISAAMVVMVIRTRRPFYCSRPGTNLALTTSAIVLFTLYLPYSPLSRILGFVPLPAAFVAALGAILVCYIITAEMTKRAFYLNHRY